MTTSTARQKHRSIVEASADYYARHSAMSDPGRRDALFEGLPGDVRSLARVIHGSASMTWSQKIFMAAI